MLDASFACQWLFQDEASPQGYAALRTIKRGGAIVPALWFSEVVNVLGLAERRGRVSGTDLQEVLSLLRSLPLTVEAPSSLAGSDAVLDLMRMYRLTAYDATYLEVARRRGVPLATKDRELLAAAPIVGVALFTVVA